MAIRVRDILDTKPVVTVRPETTIGELNRILAERGISGAPVVDDEGDVIGVVSQSDIVRLIAKDLAQPLGFYHFPLSDIVRRADLARDICEKKVADIMEPKVHAVRPDHDVATAARIMRNLHIHRVLVLDGSKLVGILSALDLLRVLADPELARAFYGEPAK